VFGDPTAEGLVADIKPDIYVKGGDYRVEDLPEASVAAAFGGRTVLVPEVPGRSSSNIIARVRETSAGGGNG
jgi:bifunctional ADP-heptose synthase (sugar kinase/adenylyltransferase)